MPNATFHNPSKYPSGKEPTVEGKWTNPIYHNETGQSDLLLLV